MSEVLVNGTLCWPVLKKIGLDWIGWAGLDKTKGLMTERERWNHLGLHSETLGGSP